MRRHLLAALLCLGTSILAVGAAPAPAADGRAAAVAARHRLAASMLTDIARARWIVDGHSAHVVYVFFDPNCPYCSRLYAIMRPWVARGDVELRWIPVGTLMPTSFGKAAAILEAKHPAAALRENEHKFARASGTFGGIVEDPLPPRAVSRQLRANFALLDRTRDDTVPTLLFRTKDGTARLIVGAPRSAFLAQLVNNVQ